MNPRRKRRLITASAIIAGLGITIGLILYAMNQNIDLFYTPTEIVNGKGEELLKPAVGQTLRVGGLVVPGTVKRDPESLKVSFSLFDSGPMVEVIYEGILPDLFREGQGIVARGKLIDGTTIHASEVLAKHDENYMPPEVAEAVNKHHVRPTGSEG